MFARNLLLNLTGQVAPLIAAALAIPVLLRELGVERFGMLTIAWMVIGYFSVFDLGLGRAMTHAVAARRARQALASMPTLVSTGLMLMLGLSALATVAILLLSTGPALHWLKIAPAYLDETRRAFCWLAFSVPAVVLTTGLRGILEAYERFDLSNLVRVPMGIWTFVGPLLVIPFSTRLDHVVIVMVFGRIVTTLVHVPMVMRAAPGILSSLRFDRREARHLFAFGGWMTVSNIISPVMVYMDRLLIGGILGGAVVAYYTTPYEAVFKLNFFPEALFGVLFPLMVARMAADDGSQTALYNMGNRLMSIIMFPLTFFIVLAAEDILTLWLGREFASHSTAVMQILAVGLCINSHAKVPFNLVQAKGRADVTAKLHLLELPIYMAALWLLSSRFGIVGAAMTWAGRMALDLVLLTWAAVKVAGVRPPAVWRTQGALALAMLLFGVGARLDGLLLKLGGLSLGTALFLAVVLASMTTAERGQLMQTGLRLPLIGKFFKRVAT